MAKNSKKQQSLTNRFFGPDVYSTLVIIALFITSFIGARFWPFSGWWLVVTFTIVSICALSIARHKDRKSIVDTLPVFSTILILLGLKLTSIGVGPASTIQNDGYNVTGGLIAVTGGVLLGLWLGLKGYKNGKK